MDYTDSTDEDGICEDQATAALARIYSRDELVIQVAEDKRKGLRTGELMTKYGLTWQEIRPIIELTASPAAKAAQKLRMASITQDAAEQMIERLNDNVKSLDIDKIPGAIKILVDTTANLSGEPVEIKEVRHTIDLSQRSQSLEQLRSAAKDAIEVDAEVVEGENEV